MVDDLRDGKRKAVAKAITIVENDPGQTQRLIREIFPDTGGSVTIGITGPAGAGKSSLINKTVIALKNLGSNPAVLAVDPTSHLTGGAILGDRVRMTESAESGTYIRSIASRGSTGAVSSSLRNCIRVLECAGFDPIIIESVGAGQTEVEISKIADITVVVFNPHTGDNIQAIKAGLTEIGDLYLVNKCDLPGADRLFDAVRDFIGDRDTRDGSSTSRYDGDTAGDGNTSECTPAVLKTSIKRVATINKLAKMLTTMSESARPGPAELRSKLYAELRDIIMANMRDKINRILDSEGDLTDRYLDDIIRGRTNPIDAGADIIESLLK